MSDSERITELELRLTASERRQAETISAISEEMRQMRQRFDARQNMLARDLGERIAALEARPSNARDAEGETQ